MAKRKQKQKLKVYRTPIGFHDAYVAAPSQKAALEAWGTDTNLFARGSAEQVTDAELMKMPLANPGRVVKVLRGTKAEQLAALAKQGPEPSPNSRRSRALRAQVVPDKSTNRPPRPSRAKLERAEKAIAALDERQQEELAEVDKQLKALEGKRRDLLRRHERQRDAAQEKLEEDTASYQSALRRYESG